MNFTSLNACLATVTAYRCLLAVTFYNADIRDGHETSIDRDETETRRLQVSRRDRDVEMHVVISCSSKQINVGLTTVATVTACSLVSWCIPDW